MPSTIFPTLTAVLPAARLLRGFHKVRPQYFWILGPLVRKSTQPPLLCFSIISAFGLAPLPQLRTYLMEAPYPSFSRNLIGSKGVNDGPCTSLHRKSITQAACLSQVQIDCSTTSASARFSIHHHTVDCTQFLMVVLRWRLKSNNRIQ